MPGELPENYSVGRLGLYVAVGLIVILIGFPTYWIFVSSIKPPSNITSWPPLLVPKQVTLENYVQLLEGTRYNQWLKNSIIVTSGNIALSVMVSTLAAYGLTRFDIPQRKNIARSLILTYMFPPLMLGIPYFILLQPLGLTNSYVGLILAHSARTVPFTTWLMWQFFQTVPISWEESAWICGASRVRSMLEIALPGVVPGIIAIVIFAFGVSWNDFTFALILISDPSKQVLTTGMDSFTQTDYISWGDLTAGAAMLILPPLVLVFTLNKYILEGFSLQGFD